jgi:hypothetical protein
MLKIPCIYCSRSISSYSSDDFSQMNKPLPPESKHAAYIIDRRKIHAIFHSISLKLPVGVDHDFAIRVVGRHSLVVSVSGLAKPSGLDTGPSPKQPGESPTLRSCLRAQDTLGTAWLLYVSSPKGETVGVSNKRILKTRFSIG